MTTALFDAIRKIKGAPLTQADVDAVNTALVQAATACEPVVFRAGEPDPELIAALKDDEGCRLSAYKDTVGVWTVGYGHAHVPPGTVWTQAKAEQVLIEDVTEHNRKIHKVLPWLRNLDPVRRRVLENMAFNLGIDGLLGFKNTLAYVQDGQYDKAADGMSASKWAKQVKGRAVRLANEMRTGKA
jgi:lysozyme